MILYILIPSFLLAGNESGKTYYNRSDGGVTVVENSTNYSGSHQVDVRRYDSKFNSDVGENKAEIVVAVIVVAAYAISATVEYFKNKKEREASKSDEQN